jgi:hypothetical protein
MIKGVIEALTEPFLWVVFFVTTVLTNPDPVWEFFLIYFILAGLFFTLYPEKEEEDDKKEAHHNQLSEGTDTERDYDLDSLPE